jgi:hypothetical protein
MKRILAIIVVVLAIAGVLWVAKAWTPRVDPQTLKFQTDADNLILGLQQYREFIGSYPTGNNITVAKALLGRTDKKVLILAVRNKSDINDKGEIMDPWRTPFRFYFAENEVMIRSAGPNKVWEDSDVPTADDLYRTTAAPKK